MRDNRQTDQTDRQFCFLLHSFRKTKANHLWLAPP